MIRYGLMVAHNLSTGNHWERAEHLPNVTPPVLSKLAIPLHRDAQTFSEAGLLVPAELTELGAVDSVPVVVERPVVCVLYPLGEILGRLMRDTDLGQQLATKVKVADLVVRADIVDLTEVAFVKNRVKSISRISRKEVATGRGSVSVKNNGLPSVQQAAEFRNNL